MFVVAGEPAWDVKSDTWTATDALGRTLPDAFETGPPKQDKYIGMFYFLWNGRHGEQGPFDVTEILAEDPEAINSAEHPLWGPIYVPHHWGESVFGYYVGDDDSVLRKHAQMLGDAGVDVIIFDVTNQLTYPESYRALCRVFQEVRAAGNHAPQVAFLTPFWSPQKVVRELWTDFYSKGEYSDLWFRWKGKPLIMADPTLIAGGDPRFEFPTNHPVEVTPEQTVGQSFTTETEFRRIGISTPTWETTGAEATLSLYREKPTGELLLLQDFDRITDNAWIELSSEKPFPPGKYYLELRHRKGKVGWWSIRENNKTPGGEAFLAGKPTSGSRTIRLGAEDEAGQAILDFFTFRKPQPDYFVGPTGPDQWSWLEIYPQHGFYTSENMPGPDGKPKKVEQVAVGTAQNAVDGRLGVLSNPRAHGRSFHDGKQPPPEECDFTGKNYAEQWSRAFELDPEFVFITGWNEWIMGRFPREAPFHGASERPVNFVDQFNREFSRDIEPMRGGHGDTFYYQMVAYNRRFKGTRHVEPIKAKPIIVDGKFDDWKEVKPEFRDTIGDPVHRDYRGWGKDSRYVNKTGLNDIVAAKVSHDANKKILYFYVRTKEPMKTDFDNTLRMRLYLDVDGNAKTGRLLGYEYMLAAGQLFRSTTKEERADDDERLDWRRVDDIKPSVSDNEMELAVPLESLGLKSQPPEIRFKWADGILETTWESFTTDGDTAPNDRYNYRAVFQ